MRDDDDDDDDGDDDVDGGDGRTYRKEQMCDRTCFTTPSTSYTSKTQSELKCDKRAMHSSDDRVLRTQIRLPTCKNTSLFISATNTSVNLTDAVHFPRYDVND